MIGIICSEGKEKQYARQLHSLLQNISQEDDSSIIVFTISNIDFIKKTVSGSLITERKIKALATALPPTIFNLSLQRDKKSIKKLKLLVKFKGVKLINDVNRFDQRMVMEMLSSSGLTRRCCSCLYNVYDKEVRDFKPDDDRDYIVMPSKGSSFYPG